MFFIVLAISFVLATWAWGDWRNWRKYHATSLFFLFGNSLYFSFTFNYPLWRHQPLPPIDSPIVVELLVMICFACTPMIYLGKWPNSVKKSLLWIALWILLYFSVESFLLFIGGIKHDNGWTLFHSLLFNIIMFPMFRLHYKRPILAYILSVPIIIVLLVWLKVPI